MSELFQKIIVSLSQGSLFDKEWIILYKEHKIIDCICGHKVKYSSTIYNKFTRTSLDVGTLCCKKYGITTLCENQILIRAIKKYRESIHNDENIRYIEDNIQLENMMKIQIEEEYNRIFGKLELEKDYYRVIPLNRLFIDLLDLQNNYQISFMTHISEIKSDIEMLEQKNDIHYQEELENTLVIDDDLSSEISLLSFYTEIPLESETKIIKEPETKIIKEPETHLMTKSILEQEEKDRRIQLYDLEKAIYEHTFGVRELILRIKLLREKMTDVREDIHAFINLCTFESPII